jgi:hypothetical protein
VRPFGVAELGVRPYLIMKYLFALAAFLTASQIFANDSPKYGFLADSDEEVLIEANDKDIFAIVLGCVYDFAPPAKNIKNPKGIEWKVYKNYITVTESFKGPLKVGEKLLVVIFAEDGPTKKESLGELNFYFLRKKEVHDIEIPDADFVCDWTQFSPYSEYGETLRKVLLKLPENAAEQDAAANP